ncbi:hypothetical protein PSm6_58920 [Pseudomonas solani]|uniref:Uncharacterized protein n=1 Tax=Pseudomonas solani TaxID=2731552 RepID=A0ABN6C3M2_9PSED|nr:hypothetical protein PSm6_58920 [Pseudomonas solani]
MLAQVPHEAAQFVVAEEGRRATAEVQLLDLLLRVEVAGDQFDLALELFQVGQGAAAILGDDLVAGAVVADVRAERHMHIERDRAQGLAAVAQRVKQVEGADALVELHGGRVGGVTRACGVVTADQAGVPANIVEHAGIPGSAVSARQSRCRLTGAS